MLNVFEEETYKELIIKNWRNSLNYKEIKFQTSAISIVSNTRFERLETQWPAY